ncbi:hypothetical protein BJF88_11870 [Cellulosimicrobium sp. CUA-896]|nr:hypothetical protein BJF88_11870 [Cellulosimicrobium sp. CUA-896]
MRAAVAEVLPRSAVTGPDLVSADLLDSPAADGMNRAFVVAIALSGLLCAAAVVMTLMIGRRRATGSSRCCARSGSSGAGRAVSSRGSWDRGCSPPSSWAPCWGSPSPRSCSRPST